MSPAARRLLLAGARR
uniref:Uncharacterized protein n=1 Tax=Arundo donax TaxID=35708 RepID=A0A0A9AT41_ARUDO